MATFRVVDEDGDYYETDGDPASRIEQLTVERNEWHRQNGVLRGELAAARAERDNLRDLLGSIWLYVKWRYVTKQLTTEQKELWADAVDAKARQQQIEDGEELRPVAERWWRDDFVEDNDG